MISRISDDYRYGHDLLALGVGAMVFLYAAPSCRVFANFTASQRFATHIVHMEREIGKKSSRC